MTVDLPSGGLCCEVNPILWQYYCQLVGRDPAPSPHWTEADVVNSLVARDMLTLTHDS